MAAYSQQIYAGGGGELLGGFVLGDACVNHGKTEEGAART